MYKNYIKRILDFLLSGIVLIILAIPLIIVGLLIKVQLGSPILFRQKRPGKNGKIFEIIKFRTMNNTKDENGNLLPDDLRLTKFGKFIRSTSIDEQPELINILKGDMSIVGPRPLLVEYLDLYNEEQKHRHDVRPGLTGLAQVNGRNCITWEAKFKYDIEYVNNITFANDCKIILKTIEKVLLREDINASENITMEKFKGNK